MILKGNVHKFDDNIDTDIIIPARYCISGDTDFLAEHCMEDIFENFKDKCCCGDIIVAGKNFGCGSSREAAVMAIKGCGIKCVIAESFARIFYRNAVNSGLLVIENSKIQSYVKELDSMIIDSEKHLLITEDNIIIEYSKNKYSVIDEIVSAGGLMEYYCSAN